MRTTVPHAMFWLLALALLTLLLVSMLPRAAAAGGNGQSAVLSEGKQEYTENCVACHGTDGKGGGDLAAKLVKPPKDLTATAAANGGSFPFWRIYETIAGETAVPGHDTHQMPDFLASLKAQENKPGYLPSPMRVLVLTHYLESLQAK